jgi:putative N-acetyltransferase (TIGR04045 family)
MIFDPFPDFLPSEYRIKFATETWEHREAAALRRAVFCDEQKIFSGDDRDPIDDLAIPIVAISSFAVVPQEVVGTVRIHEAEPGVWWGSRLAVADAYRRISALGTSLIRLAVSSAHARGCQRFYAHVQAQNVPLFWRLGWTTIEEIVAHGRPHHFMQADLNRYPPIADAETGFISLPKKAA